METRNEGLNETGHDDGSFGKAHLLRGAEMPASYQGTGVSLYNGNPFIEALPPILSDTEVIEKLAFSPPYDSQERNLPTHLRVHCINSATQFFQPLPRHVDLERRIGSMIRTGYLARNPTNPKYFFEHEQRIARMSKMRKEVVFRAQREPVAADAKNRYRSGNPGFAVVGIPGIGKTTTIENVLTQFYPQVIIHEEYHGTRVPISQVVWLMLGCPYNGSLRGLCCSFFQGMDLALGTNYHQLYTQGKTNIDDLQDDMANLAGIHGLGVLVVDELQHLTCSGIGAEKMLNFFVTLANCLRVPVLLIGTFKAIPVLSKEFRQIRRNSGHGDMIWEAMAFDENWEVFVEALWEHQYTKTPTLLTPDLSACLHDASQGITDFAIKMYMLAQVRAIANEGDEIITENIIRSVVLDSFRLAAPVLEAMRKRDWRALGEFEDVQSQDLASQIRGILSASGSKGMKETRTTYPESKTTPPEQSALAPLHHAPLVPKAVSPVSSRKRAKKRVIDATGTLPSICLQKGKDRTAPYETLLGVGIIRPVMEFFGVDANPPSL